jgi:hypothetical protein
MIWHDILVAIALVLVIEGIWPFLAPKIMRRQLLNMARQNDHVLRLTGLITMIFGVILLYIVN